MKCPSCGADYSVKLKSCPYCGTVNETAVRLEQEKEARKALLRHMRIKTAREAGPRVVIQVLNRIAAVLILVWALIFASLFAVDKIVEKKEEAKKASVSKAEYIERLEEFKAKEDYNGLADYLSEYHLSMYEDGVSSYWQLYEMYGDMRDFWEDADQVDGLSGKEAAEDTWKYDALSGSIYDVWKYGSSEHEWDLAMPENEAVYESWREQVYLYLRTEFGMTAEEIDGWLEKQELSYENEEKFGVFLKEKAAEHGEE